MYQHVLCVYPYREDIKDTPYIPPVGLELIATALEPHCREVEVVDLRHESAETADFLRSDTDMVCFSVNWEKDDDFIRSQICCVPDSVLTIVGGRHATQDPPEWFRRCPGVDIIVRGDGEEAIREIARQLPLSDIRGISWRQNGKVVHNPNRQLGSVADDLYPNRQLRRCNYRLSVAGVELPLSVDAASTSRGCPFNCKFCSFSRNPWGEKRPWSARSPESVVRELEETDADIIVFVDDNFTHDMDRVDAICRLIIKRGIKKYFLANARLEVARRMDVVRMMERAGFFALLLGIESAHDKTLRSMNKGFTRRQIEEYMGALRHSRIIMHGYFILGNIGETEEEMLETGPFARAIGLDTLSLSTLRSVPYDGLRELVEQTPGYHIRSDGLVCSDAIPRKRLRQLRRRITRGFYRPLHVAGVVRKFAERGLFTPSMLARLAQRKALMHLGLSRGIAR